MPINCPPNDTGMLLIPVGYPPAKIPTRKTP